MVLLGPKMGLLVNENASSPHTVTELHEASSNQTSYRMQATNREALVTQEVLSSIS